VSPATSTWLETATLVLTHYGVSGLIFTAFTEASFFPLPPDLILVPLCLLRPELAWWYALVTTLASSVGGVFGAFIGIRFGRPLLQRLTSEQRIAQVEHLFQHYGGWAVALAALTPIPYKVFTIAAGVFRVNPWIVLTASLGGRGLRFFLVAFAIYLWGDHATAIISTYLGPITLVLGLVLILGALLFERLPRARYRQLVLPLILTIVIAVVLAHVSLRTNYFTDLQLAALGLILTLTCFLLAYLPGRRR
jgi:membrane protein YqaA with SNARE-associated domain